MRVAVLADIHGNLPALDAVLGELLGDPVDGVVVAGDVAAGPQPWETIERLRALALPTWFVRGNADREVIDAFDREQTRRGAADGPAEQAAAFAAARITRDQRDFLATFSPTITLELAGYGPVVFCHGSPRSDTEIITTRTPVERLTAILADSPQSLIVGGHTHRQHVHHLPGQRFVNAGSVGMPYEGRPGAFWARLGPEVELRRTDYDTTAAARTLRATGYPAVDETLEESLLDPVDPDETAATFERLADCA